MVLGGNGPAPCPLGCRTPAEGGYYMDWIKHSREGVPRCQNSKDSWALYIRTYRRRRKASGGKIRQRQHLKAVALREQISTAKELLAQARRNDERLKKDND